MWDALMIAASTLFFLLAIAYIAGCDRLRTGEGK